MEPEHAVGEVLRALRRQKGLSQEALAHAAEMERNYVSLIELGRHSPSIRVIWKICAALDVTPSAFLAAAEARLAEHAKRTSATD
ncbi:helix-turn-helix transcriptional regulator [Paraburkholderia sp. MPAMCS5]|uniref:helix-turn-helix domain-containing protein n=1 Tax=Paraburkholderia sp. MPAMCS5 TaxID=3112563 RepID=UPI002E184350|nr:helix-turn-helix transcriptional regulator [Paraburkholderia sp. MPAMCS5]